MRFGLKLPETFKEYEDGKHRRYSLLFSVNGGAFAIAKIVSDPKLKTVLGGLSLPSLSAGMILFTVAMVVDIYLFGINLRSTLPSNPKYPTNATTELFAWPGRVVLIVLGMLLCLGWGFAAY